MSNKKVEKSPFRGFTIKEVQYAEQTSFVIHVGRDLYNHDGSFSFDENEANKHYIKLLSSLQHMIRKGSADERKEALGYISTLRVSPLRLH